MADLPKFQKAQGPGLVVNKAFVGSNPTDRTSNIGVKNQKTSQLNQWLPRYIYIYADNNVSAF